MRIYLDRFLSKFHLPLKVRLFGAFFSLLLGGCHQTKSLPSPALMTVQLVDRHGVHETFSDPDRISKYEEVDFLKVQPYQKVLRIYQDKSKGCSTGKLTSYHSNGSIYQYLELFSGRACGRYCQWHPNGKLHIEANVIEGVGDLSERAIRSWVFDGKCQVFNEQGGLSALFHYEKGELADQSYTYHPSGQIASIDSYEKGVLHGASQKFNEDGKLIYEAVYQEGLLDGKVVFDGGSEHYDHGKLMEGRYDGGLDPIENGFGFRPIFEGGKLRQLVEYRNGNREGRVTLFDESGRVISYHMIFDGRKNGEEQLLWPNGKVKLSIPWQDGEISGIVRSYYQSGSCESERSIEHNEKRGAHISWYPSGELMFVEEYEGDKLLEGKYFRKGDKEALSKVTHGKGVATLFDQDGWFLKKVPYLHGVPHDESQN